MNLAYKDPLFLVLKAYEAIEPRVPFVVRNFVSKKVWEVASTKKTETKRPFSYSISSREAVFARDQADLKPVVPLLGKLPSKPAVELFFAVPTESTDSTDKKT